MTRLGLLVSCFILTASGYYLSSGTGNGRYFATAPIQTFPAPLPTYLSFGPTPQYYYSHPTIPLKPVASYYATAGDTVNPLPPLPEPVSIHQHQEASPTTFTMADPRNPTVTLTQPIPEAIMLRNVQMDAEPTVAHAQTQRPLRINFKTTQHPQKVKVTKKPLLPRVIPHFSVVKINVSGPGKVLQTAPICITCKGK
ncbi:unnamed protein product, partial [Mesorhabditis spiculigera]